MDLLRLYLLTGLVTHKVVWEILKRRASDQIVARTVPKSSLAILAKAVKIVILIGLLAQTVLPYVLPITPDAGALQALGVVLFTIGLATAVSGRVQLGDSWTNIEVGGITSEHKLVVRGVYRFIRHPIYAGDLLLLLGFELALNSWLVVGVLLLAPVVVIQARREERTLEANLPGYREYRDSTKGFVPLVF